MAIVASLALIVSSLVLCFGNTPTPVDDSDNPGEGYFYSPSDGRYIILGPYWHPDAPNLFSVRYIGFSPDVPDNIADIYICVQDVYADQSLVLPFQMYNHENRALYFTIEDNGTDLTGQVADYVLYPDNTETTVKKMGSVAGSGGLDDSWTYTIAVDNIPSSLGATENMDTINLRISSWEDSEYSVLYTRDNFVINIHYIDREDIGWTVVDTDNFDDGTVQGWDCDKVRAIGDVTVTDTIYRSENYCLYMSCHRISAPYGYLNPYKSITTSAETTSAYAILTMRVLGSGSGYGPDFGICFDDSLVAVVVSPPVGVWYQLVVPIPEDNTTTKFEINEFIHATDGSYDEYGYIDDVYFIER